MKAYKLLFRFLHEKDTEKLVKLFDELVALLEYCYELKEMLEYYFETTDIDELENIFDEWENNNK